MPWLPRAGRLDPRSERPRDRAFLRAWLALQRTSALHPRQAAAALERAQGDPVRALAHLGRCAPGGGPSPAELDHAIERLARAEAFGLLLGSAAYPAALAVLADAPLLIWVRGRAEALGARAVAIVGARAATAYGRQVARRLAAEIAGAGIVVVSGLARGIDAEAHRGALEAGGCTVAVLACGPDSVYPPEHRALAERIAERGALVSELPPGAPPLRHHFPLRNRLISGLAEAVVVVEARERSGSLITARHALEQGREVLAVPGPIDAPTSRGPNLLLREGAAPVLESGDVWAALGLEPRMASARPPPVRSEQAEPTHEQGGGLAARLAALLADEPVTRDELARRCGAPPGPFARALLELELAGRVVEERDGRLRLLPRAERA